MYPTISHLIFDLSGFQIPLPIQTFGFFVALAFLIASWLLSLELKRKEKQGIIVSTKIKEIIGEGISKTEILTATITGFLVGYKGVEATLNYADFVANPQTFILSSKGHLLGGIIIAGIFVFIKYREKKATRLEDPKWVKKEIHPYELVGNMTMIAAICGIVGAKLFHNLENIGAFIADPFGQLISFSGLTFYGGLIGGAIGVIWYGKKYNIKPLTLADATAPGLMLAYGIGRIGCQLSGDGDWGIPNLAKKPDWMHLLPDWMWSYHFPHNVINAGELMQDCGGKFWEPYCYQLIQPVFPTAFYETIIATLLFLLLWILRRKINIAGIIFSIYLIVNGLERFFIEKIRVNTKYDILGGITQAEIISFCLILIGVTGCVVLLRTKKTPS